MKKTIFVLFIITAALFNTASAANHPKPIASKEVKEQITTPKTTLVNTAHFVRQWCSGGGIIQTVCPDGTTFNTGIIVVVFDCESGELYSFDYTDYSGPDDCAGHEYIGI